MKLTKKQLGVLYQLVLDRMERIKPGAPVGYIETLQELEIKIFKEIK
jgi:hypothetical protein